MKSKKISDVREEGEVFLKTPRRRLVEKLKDRKLLIELLISLIVFIAIIALVFVIWAYAGPCYWVGRLKFETPAVVEYPHALPTPRHNATFVPFAIVGDTQRTSFWECAIGREVNDEETAIIIKTIARSKAKFIVLLGDMVFDGGNEKHWNYFDKMIMPWRQANLPLLPVVGNHEYWGNRRSAQGYVEERFPGLRKSTWYSKQNGNLGMIWINSNHGEMSGTLWNVQLEWLKALIVEWDLKVDIKSIILFAHHPPYTNSVVASSDLKVRNDVGQVLLRTNKAIAMVTGHAHGYERFKNTEEPPKLCSESFTCNTVQHYNKNDGSIYQPVQFIVSGGGGGPRPKELRNDYEDAFIGDSPRPFNFLLIEPSDNGIQISTHGLQKGQTNTYLIEEMNVPYLT